MLWTLPNILTLGRIAAAPGLALAAAVLEAPLVAPILLALFLAAALTDFLDGWLARRLDRTSAVGAMLDPVADKAMVLTALMVLIATSRVGPALVLPAAIIATREVLVSGLREHLGQTRLAVTRLAKWKTVLQMTAIGILLAAEPLAALQGVPAPGAAPDPDLGGLLAGAGLALVWAAALATAITGWDYTAKGLAYITEREE